MDARERAWLSLQGLSVGDAFGERFFGPPKQAFRRIAERQLPPPPWPYTDDTEMALQPGRGYGQGTFAILCGVKEGRDWRALTQAGFRGMGSFGNGRYSARRGGWFPRRAIRSAGAPVAPSSRVCERRRERSPRAGHGGGGPQVPKNVSQFAAPGTQPCDWSLPGPQS
jgi:hypothetical protein